MAGYFFGVSHITPCWAKEPRSEGRSRDSLDVLLRFLCLSGLHGNCCDLVVYYCKLKSHSIADCRVTNGI